MGACGWLLNLGFAGGSGAAHVAEGHLADVITDTAAIFLEDLPSAQLTTDLAVFFPANAMGWAENITIDSDTIRGIVEEASTEGSDRDGPRVWVKESDWTDGGYSRGDAVVMRTLNYTVAGLHPDGFGLLELVLEES